MNPNPNLWAVDIADSKNGAVIVALFVCAATASSADTKARRHAKKLGYRAITVSRIEHKGMIDVF